MKTRLIAAGLALSVLLVIVLANESGGDPCAGGSVATCLPTDAPSPTNLPTGPASPGASQPITSPGAPPSLPVPPTPVPTAPVYTFRDEFTGTSLKSWWGRHWPGFPAATSWSKSQLSVKDGILTITARKSGSRYVSGLIDTVGKFTQRYGTFSARVKVVEGNGLWPAFWLAQPQNPQHEEAEIDVMEMCANHVGVNDGNDITLLHHYVHKIDGSHAFALGYRTVNLAQDWHTYSVDWRADHITFYLDGIETTTFTFTSDKDVSDMKMALVLDLAVGGKFCGGTATSPSKATMLVDWVRVTR